MNKSYLFTIPALFVLISTIIFNAAYATGEQTIEDLILQEKFGIEPPTDPENAPASKAANGQGLITSTIPQDSVLLIPNTSDDNVGMYDPYDGHFLGVLISDTTHLNYPINAIQGPDDNIYISDQLADAIFVYDTSGTYLSTYGDATDSLDNIRGIDFRNDTLFVTFNDPLVARFAGPHNRISDFFTGAGAFDIHFLDDGRSLLSSHASPNGIRLYDVDGSYLSQLFNIAFPEQTTSDALAPGDFLNAAYVGADQITDFDDDGTIQQTTIWDNGRGVYRLGNGNLIANSSTSGENGLYAIEPGTGNIIDTLDTGGNFRFIELFVLEGGTPFIGRCCYNDNAACVDTNQAACTALGGTWDAGLNCTDNPCPTGGDCDYVPGDVNGSDSYNGLDITYGVNYFKGGSDPLCPNGSCPIPPCDTFFYCGDVNGSCSYNGLDITYGVSFFKGGSAPINCPDCPPAP
jgi:hypothetical protein